MYIANTATTSENRKVTPSFSSQGGLTEKNMNTSYKFPFAKSHSTVMPSRETSNPLDNEIAKRKMYNVRFIKNKKEDFVVFRPYNFTVEKVSSDAIRIRWQRNKKKSVGPVATFSIKVLPYRTQQYFEAHITDLTNNIILHGLSPDSQYNLVVTQEDAILLNKSISVGQSSLPKANDSPSPTNSTLYYHPAPPTKVQIEEIVIVSFILILWCCAISLFIRRWGKIRMLVPHQPPYAEVVPSEVAPTKVVVSGSRRDLSSIDPNHPNFTSVCSSSNYSATAAAVKAAGIGTQIGIFGYRPCNVPSTTPNSTAILMACERARIWRARTRSHRYNDNDVRQNSVLSENNAAHNKEKNSSRLYSMDPNSRRVKSALDLRESFKNKKFTGNNNGYVGNGSNSFNHYNNEGTTHNKLNKPFGSDTSHKQRIVIHTNDSEQDGRFQEVTEDKEAVPPASTIVIISGVRSDIKMSVLNDGPPSENNNMNTITKDTQV
nr:uncharacterized protein LOC121128539 [Lepeophtheirus salmonis]